jgi:pyruvate, orthophosphate dikinase
LPFQREDFEGILEAMAGYGVTIRLFDPPLHEFVPHEPANQKIMADEMGISVEKVKALVEDLHEFNPMLGHRGCRLGITYPEITEMQARAIIEAAVNLKKKELTPVRKLWFHLLVLLKNIKCRPTLFMQQPKRYFEEKGAKCDYLVGTMIEIPRAAMTADLIAKEAEFFSFGTNDLTQMTFGYSRDDAGKFFPVYIEKGILKNDPFQISIRKVLDRL